LPEEYPAAILFIDRKGERRMEHLPCEPVELTELELDAVSGGSPFSISVWSWGSGVFVHQTVTITSAPTTVIQNGVDNSLHIGI
jgi:hypothetical protein